MKLRLDVMIYESLNLVDYLWFKQGKQSKDMRTVKLKGNNVNN